ncbi:unnamed protein product [Symbiodinium sp. CCMP2592]|nr:unnamed protein product [Symbiodinium sp. CCMP2592]
MLGSGVGNVGRYEPSKTVGERLQWHLKRPRAWNPWRGADFLVLGPSAAWKGEGGILAAGYLTPLWQISSSGWAEPEHPFEGGGGLGSTPAAHCSVEMEAITKSDVDLEGQWIEGQHTSFGLKNSTEVSANTRRSSDLKTESVATRSGPDP